MGGTRRTVVAVGIIIAEEELEDDMDEVLAVVVDVVEVCPQK